MLPNLYPADELVLIRNQIRRLKVREAVLRKDFLDGKAPLFGFEARVKIKTSNIRVLGGIDCRK